MISPPAHAQPVHEDRSEPLLGIPSLEGSRPAIRARDRLLGPGMLISLVACLLIDQLRALFGYSRLATNEDQTLLWYAGRELLHLHLHEPGFYGQNYNTVFEAIPGQVFHLLGASLALASPLATTLMASACWLVLAWAAHRRGHQLAAAAALALPVCMSVPYLLLFDAPRGVLTGDLLGTVAIATALTIRRPRLRLGILLAAGGLAMAWENAVALAVLPALAAVSVSEWRALVQRGRRTLVVTGGALLVPIGWLLGSHLWYVGRSFDLTAPNVDTRLAVSVLVTNLTHPTRLFSFYEPELWQQAGVVLMVIAIVLAASIAVSARFRRPAAAAAGLTFLAVLLVALSVRDTLKLHADLYLSGSRFLLPMPIGLWVVLYFTLSAIRDRPRAPVFRRRHLDPRLAITLTVAVAVASVLAATSQFEGQVHAVSAADSGARPAFFVLDAHELEGRCDALARTYRNVQAQLLVTYLRDDAYGCAAQNGLNTLNPEYDRRGWLVRAAATRPLRRILIHGWPCRSIPARAGACRPAGQGTVILVTPQRPPALSLGLAEIPVRGASVGR